MKSDSRINHTTKFLERNVAKLSSITCLTALLNNTATLNKVWLLCVILEQIIKKFCSELVLCTKNNNNNSFLFLKKIPTYVQQNFQKKIIFYKKQNNKTKDGKKM